jgi:UDP-glucose 4-epimerase
MLRMIEDVTGVAPRLNYSAVRPGDQPLYISDIRKLHAHADWKPRRSLGSILADIHGFWREHQDLISKLTSRNANVRHADTQRAEQELLAGEVA